VIAQVTLYCLSLSGSMWNWCHRV